MEKLDFYQDEMPLSTYIKRPTVIVVDRSKSMSGKPIVELNKGLQRFYEEAITDPTTFGELDLAIVSFGSDTTLERNFTYHLEDDNPICNINISGETTNIIGGIEEGIRILEERISWYNTYLYYFIRPCLILITNGQGDIGDLSHKIRAKAESKVLNFCAIGVQGANHKTLEQLCCPDVRGCLPPMNLEGLNFVKLFRSFNSGYEGCRGGNPFIENL